jgi:hypothetical protein
MALIPSSRYPGQIDIDPAYPYGKARNAGSYQDGTGTPTEKDRVNDIFGFQQALLVAANITPSGDPDTATASQYLDAVRAISVDSTLARNLTRALTLRPLDLNGVTPSTSLYLGAAGGLRGSVFAKAGTNGSFKISASPLVYSSSVTVPGLTDVRKLIGGGTRVLAIGDGGNKNAFSTTSGSSWSAGGSTGLIVVPTDGVWDGTQFVISGSGHAAHSTNGSSWATATSGSDIIDVIDFNAHGGLAALASGNVIAHGGLGDGSKVFAVTTDHGQTWSLAGSLDVDPDDYVLNGWVAGNGGSEVYCIVEPFNDDRLILYTSATGTTWTVRSEIPGFAGDFQPKLFVCQETGLLVAAQGEAPGVAVSASADHGRTWADIVYYNVTDIESLAVASGRVFATIGAKLFATDVI